MFICGDCVLSMEPRSSRLNSIWILQLSAHVRQNTKGYRL